MHHTYLQKHCWKHEVGTAYPHPRPHETVSRRSNIKFNSGIDSCITELRNRVYSLHYRYRACAKLNVTARWMIIGSHCFLKLYPFLLRHRNNKMLEPYWHLLHPLPLATIHHWPRGGNQALAKSIIYSATTVIPILLPYPCLQQVHPKISGT